MSRALASASPGCMGREKAGRCGLSPWRFFLYLAGLDSLLAGAWAVVRPGDLFALLGQTPPRDAFLWQVLGGISLGHAACLLLAARRPGEYSGLVLIPLVGRVLGSGIWLWLLGTDRVVLPSYPLMGLLIHDAIWVPGFAAFLFVAPRRAPAQQTA
jgi:hypothetical protein